MPGGMVPGGMVPGLMWTAVFLTTTLVTTILAAPSFTIDYTSDSFVRNGKPHRWSPASYQP